MKLKCLEKAGLKPEKDQFNNLSDDCFLEDLKRVAQNNSKNTVTTGDYKNLGRFDRTTVLRRFGSWGNALKKAGLEPTGFEKDISNEDLLIEIERLWVKIGRQPTTTDIKNGLSIYSLNTFSRRFGSWRKALEVFIDYINSDTIEEVFPKLGDENESIDTDLSNKAGAFTHFTKRDINLRLRFLIFQRDKFKCRICGASPAKDPCDELHVDHIKPWSKGGETIENNLQTLYSICNLVKSNLIIQE